MQTETTPSFTPSALLPVSDFTVSGEEHFSADELKFTLEEITRLDRTPIAEKPISLWIAGLALIFAVALLATGFSLVPQFMAFKALHTLTLGTIALSCAVLTSIHVLGARLRAL